MNKNKSFIDSLPLTIASLGEKTGIKVVFGSGKACTDMKTVMELPVLKEDADLGDRSAFLGLLVHECGHVRHTNPNTSQNLGGFSFELFNVIEDIRIENLMAKEYPGSVSLIAAAELKDLKNLEFVGKIKNPFRRYSLGILIRGNICFNHKSYYQKAEEVLLRDQDKYLPKYLIEESYKLLEQELPKLTSSDDALELSKKLEMLFRKTMQHLEAANCSKSEEPSGSQKKSRSKKSSAQQSKLDEAEKELDNLENPFDFSSRLKKLLEEIRDKSFPLRGRVSSEELGNRNGTGKGKSEASEDSIGSMTTPLTLEHGKEIISKARAIVPGLKRSLRGLTESKSRDAVSTGYSGKRLDSGRLSRLANWDMRIFRKVSETTKRSTAFHILIDRSGSMGTQGMREEMICATALFEAVSAVPGTNPAISAFPGLDRKYRVSVVPHGTKKLDTCTSEVGAVHAFGYTPFLEAISEIDFLLRSRPEDRKVLFVITDGMFSDSEDDIKELKEKLSRHNIETCCIGIGEGTNELEDFFGKEYFRCIEDSSELQKAVFELSKQMMTK